MKKLYQKSISVILVIVLLAIGIVNTNFSLNAYASETITHSISYDKLIKISNFNNLAIYSYTASTNKTITVVGNVWEQAILHIEAYSDLDFLNLITETHTVVPNGDWAAAPTPRIFLNIKAEETVYIKAYADNPRLPTLDLNNVTIVLGADDCVDLTNAKIILPTNINEYGWEIFKDAFNVIINNKSVSPGNFEIVYNGTNIEGKYLNPGKHIITVRGINQGIGSKDIEIEVKPKYICVDCNDVFINEFEYNNHLAEEIAKKEYEYACMNAQVTIRMPSITTVRYGESVVLYADLKSLPENWKIVWSSNNDNFSFSTTSDGRNCIVSPILSGDTTFTVSVYDSNGNIISTDTQIMISRTSFINRLLAFFANLFEPVKSIINTFENLFYYISAILSL